MSIEPPVGAVFFDLFGTLLSLRPLDEACDRLAPGQGAQVAARWRARQLEASWLLTAMERWADFDVVTRDALAATLDEFSIARPSDIEDASAAFLDLPLVDGAGSAIRTLQHAGVATGVLTNASQPTLNAVAARLGLGLDPMVSVDGARRFKPHPAVYQLAVDAMGLEPRRIGFVTANGWDAAGAGAFGFRVAWLRRDRTVGLPSVGAPEPTIATWADVTGTFLSR